MKRRLLPDGVSRAVRALGLALVLLLLALPRALQAQFSYYTNSFGTLCISGYTGPGGVVSIPDTIDGLMVTGIDYGAFINCPGLLSVTIPQSVTFIEADAFAYCTGLTNVTIPAGVTWINGGVFNNCTNLAAIEVDEENPSYCSVDGVVFNAWQSELVAYPAGKPGSYTIPSGVTELAAEAFRGCAGLTSVSLPEGLQNLPFEAFYECSALTNVSLPGVTNIGDSAFADCSSLGSVTLPARLKSIETSAFSGCTSLAQLTIPKGVTSIAQATFNGSTNLSRFTVSELNPKYRSVAGVLFTRNMSVLLAYPLARSGSYTIPNGVTEIGGWAFGGSLWLSNVTFPSSVRRLDAYAFASCGSTSLRIPRSVTSIGEGAFLGCPNLVSVSLPEGLRSVPGYAFVNCTALTNVFLPDSITNIGTGAFNYCWSLPRLRLPKGLTSIGDAAFQVCFALTEVDFSGNAPRLEGDYVFDMDDKATVYYAAGSTGWDTTLGGVPTVPVACYQPESASYNGLFYESGSVRWPRAGAFSLSSTANGKFTGKLMAGGVSYPLSGHLDAFGHAQAMVARRNASDLQVDLQMVGTNQITGTVIGSLDDGPWTAALSGDRAWYDAKSSLAPQAGHYTLVIPGSAAALEPGGNGWATVVVDKAGHVRVSGALADGTRFTQAAPLSREGVWPLQVPLYRGQGVLMGWLDFTSGADSDLGGQLSWVKLGMTKGLYYPSGFSLSARAWGERYAPPLAGAKVLEPGDASVVLSGAGLSQEVTNRVTISANSRVTSTDKTRLRFTPATGAFSGSVPDPEQPGKLIGFSGVVLQGQSSGYGWFLRGGRSGQVYLGE